MVEVKIIKQLADRHQTTTENIIREYFQHLFLSLLYQEHGSEFLLFKGETALRIIWQSPRFSEDLDFDGRGILVPKIETLAEAVLTKIERNLP